MFPSISASLPFFFFYLDFVPRLSLYILRFFYHCSNTFCVFVCVFFRSLESLLRSFCCFVLAENALCLSPFFFYIVV